MQNKKRESKNSLSRKFRLSEFLAENTIKLVSFTSFAIIILIFVFVFREATPIFFHTEKKAVSQEFSKSESYGDESAQSSKDNYSSFSSGSEDAASFKNLTQKEWQPVSENPKYGLLPLFIGSLKATILAILFGAPLAILAAIFSALFASKRLKEIIKPAIELLASFPSVVIGFFALMTIATFFQSVFGLTYRLNAFTGGVAMAFAIIPIIYTVTEDALTAVPKYFSEASLALGATKWQTALFVIMPAATPGIFAALLLGFGRAFGETMILLMATGNAPLSSFNIFEPVRTMSATIGAEMAEVVVGDTHYTVLFFIGALLFVITFIINAIAEFYVRAKLMKRFRGE
ncbi:MAG: phosphate ABC transporter permease subunit PstC [Ignavibacteriales bacterium]|nr:MAG: phosphate ABC transporter permease subunit PstC [Ignavibacteriales bacterium]